MREFRNSLCASPFAPAVLAQKVAFRAGDRFASDLPELQRLMMAYGSCELFTRLGSRFTGPEGGDGAQQLSTLEWAELARSLQIPLNPELLLCARYGDESGQPAPDFSDYPQIQLRAPWHELEIGEMCEAVRLYGELEARRILETGVGVSVWDLGNEVELGIAGLALQPFNPRIGERTGWTYQPPDAVDPAIGRMSPRHFFALSPADMVAWAQEHLWCHVGSILAALAEGIREAAPGARFATHVGGLTVRTPELLAGFYQSLEAAGFVTEELGASFYPTAHHYFAGERGLRADTLTLYKESAELAMKVLGKPVYIAEYGYAAGPIDFGGQSWAHPVEGYGLSVEAQARFLRDLVEWGVSSGTLSGIRPWAPDLVGGGWQGMALFEAPIEGVAEARPGLSAIQDALEAVGAGR